MSQQSNASNNPTDNTQLPSPEEQLKHAQYQEDIGASRVNKIHGGELVEAISTEDLVTVSDPDCKHETMILDPTETLGTAYVCANRKCGIVAIYNKGE